MSTLASRSAWRPFAWSLAGHGLLVALLLLNLPFWEHQSSQPVRLAIDAVVVPDVTAVQERERQADQRRREEDARRRAEEAKRVEAQREADLARQREVDARREAEAARRKEAEQIALEKRRAEEQRQLKAEQAEAARRAEAQRKAEAEAARRAEEQRQAELARERQAQAKREAEARRQQEREAQLVAALAAEQAREDAVRGGLLDQWIEVIRQHVQRNWIRPPGAGAGLECEVRVAQIPGGDVVDVRVGACNADAAVVRTIENAVRRASPLPAPPDPKLFERNIIFIFKPTD